MKLIEYKVNQADIKVITTHLNECDALFNPPLSSSVTIKNYAEKIKVNAFTFEAWDGKELIGLVACYLNDKETLQGYVTNVSVLKKMHRKGIAKELLEKTQEKAIALGFKLLKLEVDVNNEKAIKFYKSLGFELSGRIGSKYFMVKRLNEKNDVVVSVCCITYNHVKFIRDAIEGFLMQKTSFPFEILIHDDASTDGTAEIIREYEKKHPDLIFPIYQKENQYSQGRIISPTYQFPRARGKYIALCEGDDYWTDKLKLQKQVGFLEGNEEYSLTAGQIQLVNPDASEISGGIWPVLRDDTVINVNEIGSENHVHTATVLFRKKCLTEDYFEFSKEAPIGDYFLFSFLLLEGNIKIEKKVLASYRMHSGSIYSSRPKIERSQNLICTKGAFFSYLKKTRPELISPYVRNTSKSFSYSEYKVLLLNNNTDFAKEMAAFEEKKIKKEKLLVSPSKFIKTIFVNALLLLSNFGYFIKKSNWGKFSNLKFNCSNYERWVEFKENDLLIKEAIFTTYFSSKKDPQRLNFAPSNSIEYIAPWYNSIQKHKILGIVFYDHLSESFIQKYENEYVQFRKCTIGPYSLNDERFFIYNLFLKKSNIEKLFCTDGNDVEINKTPFELINSNKLLVGRDSVTKIYHSNWMQGTIEVFKKTSNIRIPILFKFLPVYNAGIIGGRRKTMLFLLNKMTALFDKADTDANNDMVVLNLVIFRHFRPWLFFKPVERKHVDPAKDYYANSKFLKTGYPLNSAFGKFEKDTNAYFIHK